MADLRRYYGVRLLDLETGELTWAELLALVEVLPVGSATWAAVNNFPMGWSLTNILLADVFHALAGQPHPARPSADGKTSGKDDTIARLVAQRERSERERLESTVEG